LSAVGWRRLVHATHALATLVLIGTGLLLQMPDWRARLVGGYGRQLAEIHEWAGAVFVAIPLLALTRAARPLLRDTRRRLGPPDPWSWKKLHIVLSLAGGLLLGTTGIVLWFDRAFPLVLLDLSLELHAVLTWVFLAMLAVHLVAARRKMAGKIREWSRGGAPRSDDPLQPSGEEP
jgi:cytochrome b subunit of formate dehydrogenase